MDTLSPNRNSRLYPIAIFGVLGATAIVVLGLGMLFLVQHPGTAGIALFVFFGMLAAAALLAAWKINEVFGPVSVTVDSRLVVFRVGRFKVREFGRAYVSHVRQRLYEVPRRPLHRVERMPILQFVSLDGSVLGSVWTNFYDVDAISRFLRGARLELRDDSNEA